MLVNWTFTGVKAIPVRGNSKEMVVLGPGYNQVDDGQWAGCRDLVLCQIANGDIVEEWQDVEKDGKEDKNAVFRVRHDDPKLAATTVRVPITFKEITRKRIKDVIAETYNPKTLQAWYDDESRDDVRVLIFRQLEGVNSGAITGEKKKK
jgi:hypothetical protein